MHLSDFTILIQTKKQSRIKSKVPGPVGDGSEVFLLVAAFFVYIRLSDETPKVLFDIGRDSVGLSFQFVSSGLKFLT